MQPENYPVRRTLPTLIQESQRLRDDLEKNIEKLQLTLAHSRGVAAEWGWTSTTENVSHRRSPVTLGVLDALTKREIEVLRLIAEGKSTKQIADQMGIAFKTAVCHRSRILQKLEVHETATLVRLAIRAGLIEA